MTAAQTTIPAKNPSSLRGIILVGATCLLVAVVGVAMSVRPVTAPASILTGNPGHVLTLGHDESRAAAPVLTLGHDESRDLAVPAKPTRPFVPRSGGTIHFQ
ncbi:MAG: hypothetical protein QOF11_2420 [Chloroflexota bacterium]|jgi:hypothetical protein|nr:hypothetical protein [Chloroflexota bacterium]